MSGAEALTDAEGAIGCFEKVRGVDGESTIADSIDGGSIGGTSELLLDDAFTWAKFPVEEVSTFSILRGSGIRWAATIASAEDV